MAGTKKGGRKAAATNKMRYGLNFYEQIGRLGGLRRGARNHDGTGRGFAANRAHASAAGKIGVQRSIASRRAKAAALRLSRNK